jgi:hypothetical protein
MTFSFAAAVPRELSNSVVIVFLTQDALKFRAALPIYNHRVAPFTHLNFTRIITMSIESISPKTYSGPARPAARSGTNSPAVGTLTEAEQEQLRQLKGCDAEVRQHEQAYVNAAGPYVKSGPHYDYQTGPDGQRYAVGGEVELDISPVPDDPEATPAPPARITAPRPRQNRLRLKPARS